MASMTLTPPAITKARAIPPARRPELIVTPFGDAGQFVVKDPQSGGFFNIGEIEAFLLAQLDGKQTVAEVCAAFAAQFNDSLSAEDLDEFVALARKQGFLKRSRSHASAGSGHKHAEAESTAAASRARKRPNPQQLVYFRQALFDPDRLLNWLTPKLEWVWTRAFLFVSLAMIVAAAVVLWQSRHSFLDPLAQLMRWESFVIVWFVILAVTGLHELAHGVTCKHYGGEVHEIGVLFMMFMPCMFCNVSDAWLFKEKSKRLLVSLAGGYCDLCIFALAVFVWRLTVPGVALNHLAWVVLSVCGIRVFLNFNPLLKLDGYYLLSDLVSLPNLRRKSMDYVIAHLRWLLWGAQRPTAHPRGKLLMIYGLARWIFGVIYLLLIFLAIFGLASKHFGLVGALLLPLIVMVKMQRYFRGFFAGEVGIMMRTRPRRSLVWLGILVGLPAVLFTCRAEDRAAGTFHMRPAQRFELRAPVSGFLKSVYVDEGNQVNAASVVGRMEIPDLASKLVQKISEAAEARAILRLLETGARPEELAEQRKKVARVKQWWELARSDLDRKRHALAADLDKFTKQVNRARTEVDFQSAFLHRLKALLARRGVAAEKYLEAEKDLQVKQAMLDQAAAVKSASEAKGTLEDEAELAKREKEYADAKSILVLLEAGTRPEEIEAQRARLAALQEGIRYLETMQGKLDLRSAATGVVATPHLREKVGQYFNEGDLICEIEDPNKLEAEIPLEEQEVTELAPGQRVLLKVRALPFELFEATVDRIAPAARKDENKANQATLTVAVRLANEQGEVRPGMTGYARIYTTSRPVAMVVVRRVLRYLRTEFWW